jgi:hypothetical protein
MQCKANWNERQPAQNMEWQNPWPQPTMYSREKSIVSLEQYGAQKRKYPAQGFNRNIPEPFLLQQECHSITYEVEVVMRDHVSAIALRNGNE